MMNSQDVQRLWDEGSVRLQQSKQAIRDGAREALNYVAEHHPDLTEADREYLRRLKRRQLLHEEGG